MIQWFSALSINNENVSVMASFSRYKNRYFEKIDFKLGNKKNMCRSISIESC